MSVTAIDLRRRLGFLPRGDGGMPVVISGLRFVNHRNDFAWAARFLGGSGRLELDLPVPGLNGDRHAGRRRDAPGVIGLDRMGINGHSVVPR